MEHSLDGALALAQTAAGPLSGHLPGYVRSLAEQGYSATWLYAKTQRAFAFDAWLAHEGTAPWEVAESHIDRYHRRPGRPRSDCRARHRLMEPFALRQFLRYLRERGGCSAEAISAVPATALAAEFEQFLLKERGLAATTSAYYRTFATDYLAYQFGDRSVDLGAIRASDLIEFIRCEARRRRPRTLKQIVTALRAFLRYAQFLGQVDASLAGAVPAVAFWATTPPLPRSISPGHARRVIDGCVPTTAIRRRDRAILLLLARLGLRSGEVVKLLLDDVDWTRGYLRVRGKNRHECLMPLPSDVGEAIVDYLRHGRPPSPDRHLFLRARAPFRGFLHDSDGIGSVVRNALRRAGVDVPHKGAHQFRHALAVRLLQQGASLPEIGELLRHRSPLATSIYARVDLDALRPLAMPWPGGAA